MAYANIYLKNNSDFGADQNQMLIIKLYKNKLYSACLPLKKYY